MAVLAGGAPAAPVHIGLYGTSSVIDMPTAEGQPDGTLALTFGAISGTTRSTLTFQVTPWLSGSFRYSSIDGLAGGGTLYDRSFDIQLRLMKETDSQPAVAVGLRDFIGTGIYAGEYFVATKEVLPGVKLTGGLGWGRLGSFGGLGAPLGGRAAREFDLGGEPELGGIFRGQMAPFGGVQWQATDKLSLSVEYSSDRYEQEEAASGFDHRTPINLGAGYRLGERLSLSGYFLHGDTLGVSGSVIIDPASAPNGSGVEPAPPPVFTRADEAPSTGWTAQPDGRAILRDNIATLFAGQGLRLVRLEVNAGEARIGMENLDYDVPAEALGRAARLLTRALPASVERLTLILIEDGVGTAAVSFRRRDIETLVNASDASWRMLARASIVDPATLPPMPDAPVLPGPGARPRLDWSVGPDVVSSLFDPDNPLRADLDVQATATYHVTPGLSFSGSVRKTVVGNLDEITRESNSVLPRVRSDFARFLREGDPGIDRLTGDYVTSLGPGLYGRASAGLLERMYGGVSGEVLWKPVNSRLGLGVEVNYARKRDFDMLFGFRDFEVWTGHASAYYDFGNGFHGQIDAGRYLARDWGATFTLDREFDNGWKVGGFFTLTDVPFDEFGEGSFDKGIRVTVPLSWVTGQPSRDRLSTTLRPLTRDGGARLNVANRLYPAVRANDARTLVRGWGRFWR